MVAREGRDSTTLGGGAIQVGAARPGQSPRGSGVLRAHARVRALGSGVQSITEQPTLRWHVFTSWRNRTEEDHLFLIPGLTEFDYIYRFWSVPGEPPPPPLEPGHYRAHAEDIQCEVHTSFRVTR